MRLPFISAFIKSTPYASGLHPLYLSISYKTQRAFISLEYAVKRHHWDPDGERCYEYKVDTVDGTVAPNYAAINALISEYKNEGQDIIEEVRKLNKRSLHRDLPITAADLKNRLLEILKPSATIKDPTPKDDLLFYAYAEKLMADMQRNGKVGNHRRYQTALAKFAEYIGDGYEALLFSQITPKLITGWAEKLKEINKQNTVYSSIKVIKAIYHKARVDEAHEYLLNTPNIFERIEIDRGMDGERKKLTAGELHEIMNIDLTEHPAIDRARDIFMFQFHAEGMRIGDALLLSWQDIRGNEIQYKAAKTGKGKSVDFYPEMEKIIDKYRKPKHSTIFGVIPDSSLDDKVKLYNAINSATAIINRNLKLLQKMTGTAVPITTHIARHTKAVMMYDKTKNIKLTQHLLNHGSSDITDQYLKRSSVDPYRDDKRKAHQEIMGDINRGA